MTPVIRRIVAVVLSCGVAILIVRLLEELAKQVTMPAGLDPTNAAQMKTALEHGEFPFASLALVFCGWLLASYTGSRIASQVGQARIAPLAFTVLFTLVILHDLTALPHPTWMWIGGVFGVPLVALGAAGETITFRTL